jgi:hypothetical protein
MAISLLIPQTDVASGAHITAPTAFSIPNDAPVSMAKDKKRRKRRVRKIRAFLQDLLLKKSTGLTSIQNSSIIEDPQDNFDQGVVLGLQKESPTEPLPGDIENFPQEFTYPFGFHGATEFDLPPANYRGRLNPEEYDSEDYSRELLKDVSSNVDRIAIRLRRLREYLKQFNLE